MFLDFVTSPGGNYEGSVQKLVRLLNHRINKLQVNRLPPVLTIELEFFARHWLK